MRYSRSLAMPTKSPATNATTTIKTAVALGLVDTQRLSVDRQITKGRRCCRHRFHGRCLRALGPLNGQNSSQGKRRQRCSNRPEPRGKKVRHSSLHLHAIADARGQTRPHHIVFRLVAKPLGIFAKPVEKFVVTHGCPRINPPVAVSVCRAPETDGNGSFLRSHRSLPQSPHDRTLLPDTAVRRFAASPAAIRSPRRCADLIR